MSKIRITYDSPIDAIVALTKHLATYETRYGMTSEEFYDKFCKGLMEDSIDFIEWANDYQHFLALKLKVEEQLTHVA